jgi:protein-disulfide isomerase
MMGFRRFLVLPFLVSLACSRSQHESNDSASTEAGANDAPPGARVLAIVDGTEILADQVDAPLRIDLHELEQVAYQRRLDRIRTLAGERLGAEVDPGSSEWESRVEVRLAPPTPLRLEIPDSPAPIRGPVTAPVTLVEFVDFESAHCRRLQPEIVAVLDRYPTHVRLAIRDLPLAYHRQAAGAARAAHCAGEQEAYWAYHDLLLLEQPALAPPDLERYAERLGLDRDRFAACLASDRHEARILADLELAAMLGVHRAPTLFVNGLYSSGVPNEEEIDRLVRSELERLGLAAPSESPAAAEAGSRSPASATGSADEEQDWPHLSPDEIPDPEMILTLDREDITRALEDRRALDRKLEASPATFSGQRLLKLRKVDEHDLYTRLGLEPGDVLMLVDGRFVTAERNRLWDELAAKDSLTLLVMRRGRPHTFLYRIR